jgi:two-component system sensor histidine kinase UhpB
MNAAGRELRVLLVEDSENDAALLEIALRRAGFDVQCERVETAEAMAAALERQPWDVVIADYVMPSFDGLSALALVKKLGLDQPFIVVSGHITDDTAVAAMKAGAHDYVMKDNLTRLGPAVERELRDAEVRHARKLAEKKLWEEHAFRHAIENSIPSGIAVVNLEGRQTYVNPAFCSMVGWDESELIGAKPPFAYWPPEELEAINTALTRFIEGGPAPPEGFETRFCRKNGERFDVLVLVTRLRDHFDNVSGWLNSVTDITQRKQAEAALRRSHEELETRVRERTEDLSTANAQLQSAMLERRRLEHELLEITEKERRRIGLDLHDDLGQKLSGVALMAKGLQLKLAKQKSSDAKDAEKIHKLIQQAMDHASDVAHDLATLDFQENDLRVALKGLAAHAKDSFGISCRLQTDNVPPLESTTVRQLYKITQEALTNAIKHGKAKRVSIALSVESDMLLLKIRNTGVPFPSVVSQNAGMGLRIMNYRASLIDAKVEIGPGRPDGTIVTCTVPMSRKRQIVRSHG